MGRSKRKQQLYNSGVRLNSMSVEVMRKTLLTLKLILHLILIENPHLKLEQYQEEWVNSLDRDDKISLGLFYMKPVFNFTLTKLMLQLC